MIQTGNEDIVHHFIAYSCLKNARVAEHEGDIAECWTANMPDRWLDCAESAVVWAIGAVVYAELFLITIYSNA